MAIISFRVYSKLRRLSFKYSRLSLEEFKKSQYFHILNSVSCVYGEFCSVDALKLGYDKLYNSLSAKRKRYKKRLRNMLFKFGQLYLVSLTFTDDVLNSTSFDTRKKYVQRWCKEFTLDYFGCVDFGKRNGREHYHIICALDCPMSVEYYRKKAFYRFDGLNSWSYGFSSCRIVKNSYGDAYSSLNYAFKSALYSFKSADSVYKPFFARGVDYSSQYYYSFDNGCFL